MTRLALEELVAPPPPPSCCTVGGQETPHAGEDAELRLVHESCGHEESETLCETHRKALMNTLAEGNWFGCSCEAPEGLQHLTVTWPNGHVLTITITSGGSSS